MLTRFILQAHEPCLIFAAPFCFLCQMYSSIILYKIWSCICYIVASSYSWTTHQRPLGKSKIDTRYGIEQINLLLQLHIGIATSPVWVLLEFVHVCPWPCTILSMFQRLNARNLTNKSVDFSQFHSIQASRMSTILILSCTLPHLPKIVHKVPHQFPKPIKLRAFLPLILKTVYPSGLLDYVIPDMSEVQLNW